MLELVVGVACNKGDGDDDVCVKPVGLYAENCCKCGGVGNKDWLFDVLKRVLVVVVDAELNVLNKSISGTKLELILL